MKNENVKNWLTGRRFADRLTEHEENGMIKIYGTPEACSVEDHKSGRKGC